MITLLDRRAAQKLATAVEHPHTRTRANAHSLAESTLDRMIGITEAIATLPIAGPEQNFRDGLRAQLLAAADREGIGALADNPEPEPQPAKRITRRRAVLTRPYIAGIAGIIIAVGTLGSVSLAASDAAPGSSLYDLKRSTENIQLNMASSDKARGALYLEFAQTRLSEAITVRGDITSYGGAMSDMDVDTLTGVRLLTSWALTHHRPDTLNAVDTFVNTQRATLDQLIRLVRGNDKTTTRTALSKAILDAVAERSRTLRTAIECNATATGQADALGPVAATCTTTTTTRPAGQTTVTVEPGGEVTITKPMADTSPTPGSPSSPAPSGSPGPAPSASPSSDGGLLGQVGRILGGILGD